MERGAQACSPEARALEQAAGAACARCQAVAVRASRVRSRGGAASLPHSAWSLRPPSKALPCEFRQCKAGAPGGCCSAASL
jgi:hypothetical protein